MTSLNGHGAPAGAPAPVHPLWENGQPARAGTAAVVLAALGIVIGAFLLLAVLAYFAVAFGVAGVGIAAVSALVPLVIVLLTVRWIDRWEPEPRTALWFAFLWGAGASVVIALLVDLSLQISASAGGPAPSEFTASVVQAPLVEEGAKGFGVLLILWFARRYFDGPLDGVVYAATVAGGFAFTENILYFGNSLVEGGSTQLGSTLLVRGIFSPFAHVMFTTCTGLALGLAARRTGPIGAIGFFLLGLIPAVMLHALWNGAFYFVTDLISYYLLVQVPLFLLAVVLVVLLRRHERAITRAHLAEYAEVGWFTPGEVDLLSTWTGRRRALAWARSQPAAADGSSRVGAMRRFVRDSTRLAHTRHRLVVGRSAIGSAPDEQSLLVSISEDRRALVS
ncbi:MAG: PrsW family intrarane metalloprotease [Naasia sp.]|uniref:PrsW family intramembrane metalloprotease n=1 Tax=Naasia sp. TaxID=2546198 RepID=UPI00260CFB4A|nr:PrsW family intramembrane metalloprotease [Naasia sp.]MCU1571336.1 PrsW family intrarane metalloprotease [Naasia sp.]